MSIPTTVSSWRDTIFSACAEFLDNPNDSTIGRVKALLGDYQRFYKLQQVQVAGDEHEQVWNYR